MDYVETSTSRDIGVSKHESTHGLIDDTSDLGKEGIDPEFTHSQDDREKGQEGGNTHSPVCG